MQWIRFDASLEQSIEQAFDAWKARLATHDAKEAEQRQLVEGPKSQKAVAKLVDRRFIDYLMETGIPFERP